MPKGYMLTAEAVQKIQADHESLKLQVMQLQAKANRAQSQVAIENIIYVKITEIVTPASGGVLGTGKAVVQEFDVDEKTVSNQTKVESYGAEKTDRTIDVYNESQIPVMVDSIVLCFRDFKSGLFIIEPIQTAIAKSNGISGRSGTTAGSGTASIYYLDGSTLTDTSHDLTVYNIADATIASGAWITIKRNANGSNWYVDMEACG
tara:strand:+ start:3178 stop:3792 length:615 start_codon:yes stop_codon:yes gene_type:complete